MEGRMESADALCAILHQLFHRDRTGYLISYALDAYKAFGNSLQHQLDALWRILVDCANSPESGEIVCLLDALDECNEKSLEALFDKLKDFYGHGRHQTTPKLKFFITSRPYDRIANSFRKFSGIAENLRLDAENNSDDIASDISWVIDERLHDLAGYLSPEDRGAIAKQLKGNMNRTYLYLHLIFGIIMKKRSFYSKKSNIEELLSHLPSDVDEAYEHILSGSQDDTVLEILLRIVLAASRPLTLDEMNIALTLSQDGGRLDSMAALKSHLWPDFQHVVQSLSGMFISVYKSELFFIHQTAREFLLKDERRMKWQGRLDMQSSHQTLSQVCTQYLRNPDSTAPRFERLFLSYAAPNWPLHYASQGSIAAQESLEDARALCYPSEHNTNWYVDFIASDRAPNIGWRTGYEVATEMGHMSGLALASYLGLPSIVDDMLARGYPDGHCDCLWDCDLSLPSPLNIAMLRGYPEVMQVFLDKDKNEVTQGLIEYAAKHCKEPVVALLLAQDQTKARITNRLITNIAQNDKDGFTIMKSLLDARRNEVGISKDVLEAAARNILFGRDIMKMLLDERGGDFKIAKNVVMVAVMKDNWEFIELLLDKRADEIKITDDIITTSATKRSLDTMKLLLEKRGTEVKITEDVIQAVARNNDDGMMSLLLGTRKDEITTTEDVFKTALLNYDKGTGMIELLLDERTDQFKITEDMLQAVAMGDCSNKMKRLLDKRGDEIKITEGVLKAAATSARPDTIRLLLDERGDEIEITEDVLKTAMTNQTYMYEGLPGKLTAMLLKGRDDVKITEGLLMFAVETGREQVLEAILKERGDDVKVTVAVIEGAEHRGIAKSIVDSLRQAYTNHTRHPQISGQTVLTK